MSTFIFGIDKDSDFPQTITKPSSEPQHPTYSEVNKSPKSQTSEPSFPPKVSENVYCHCPVTNLNEFSSYQIKDASLESSTEEAATVASCGPFASVAVGRLSAIQNWLRRDGSVAKEAPSPPPRSRFVLN